MGHPQDVGDVPHRHPISVGPADRLVSILAQPFGRTIERLLVLSVFHSERPERGPSLRRCFASLARDVRIVERILANELAKTFRRTAITVKVELRGLEPLTFALPARRSSS